MGLEVVDDVDAVIRVGEDGAQTLGDSPVGVAPGVMQPMQGLDHTHAWPAGPVEPAGRGGSEIDLEVAERDGLQPGIGMHYDAGRYGIGETNIVGSGRAIDQDTGLVPASQCMDDGVWIGVCKLARKMVDFGLVIEAAGNPANVAIAGQSMEHLVDGVARAQVEKVLRRPD